MIVKQYFILSRIMMVGNPFGFSGHVHKLKRFREPDTNKYFIFLNSLLKQKKNCLRL